MANKQRPEERLAATVLTDVLGIHVDHTDLNGEADLGFVTATGVTAAVEVTYLTNQQLKASQDAWMKERQREYTVTQLASTWNVTVHANGARYRGLRKRLEPALAALESEGLTEYDEWGIGHRLSQTMPELVRSLRAERVAQAFVLPTKDPTVRHIFISPMAGYSARGSDATLELIETYLADREDNPRKLAAAGADEGHLFLLLDLDTPGEIARPFTGGSVTEWDHFGLPSRPPVLAVPITNLWVVHEGTGNGWSWSSSNGWTHLDVSASIDRARQTVPVR